MTHNLTHLYLSALVPPSVSNISRYSLRNSNDLQTIDARTTLYYNSFLPSTVRAWNNVNDEAKQANSVNTFKCFLNKDKTRIPKHFYVGSRKAQVLHTRLRTIALSQILETVVIFHFSGGKVYSLNKGCHTCMIKHTMHVQLLHCSIYLTWLDMCIYRPKVYI